MGNTANSAHNRTLTGLTGDATLILPPGATYRVEINGVFPRIYINNGADRNQIRSVEQWGNISWTSMERAFYKAYNLQLNATDAPDLSGVTSLREMFYGAEFINAPVGHWDASTITDMHGLFRDAELFNQDLSNWDVSNVTDMAFMFFWNLAFNGNISNWDVSSVKTMRNMFGLCRSFNQDISGWDVGQVEQMEFMFSGAWAFNQDIGGWDVSNVKDLQNFLQDARAFNYSLGNWNISSVSNMVDMLDDAGLSLANYDETLQGWAAQTGLQNNVVLGAKGLEFCAGKAARQKLINDFNWTINDDTKAADCAVDFFITVWKTDNPGGSGNNQIRVPAHGQFNYTWVDVNDATVSGSGTGQNETQITFPQPGTYELRIEPTGADPFNEVEFNDFIAGNDTQKLIEVKNWGTIR